MATSSKPLPMPDDLTRPYWDGAAAGRLVIQRCQMCATFVHPPESICPRCNATNLGHEEVSGRGTLYSFTVVRDNITRGFEDEVPYIVGLIELAEQPRLLVVANVRGVAPEAVRVGMPLEVTFERLADDVQLPQFRPAGAP